MPSESKLMAKLQKLEEKAKGLLAKNREHSTTKGKVPAPATPLISGAAAGIGGYADGRLGTADNKHPASIALGAVQWVGSIAAAFMGHPTASQVAASGAAGNISFLTGSAMYDKGQTEKLKASAPST